MADFDAIVVGAGNAALDIGARPFGGWRINDRSDVQDLGERTIPGLYGAREMVGGQFCENYPGGSLRGLDLTALAGLVRTF